MEEKSEQKEEVIHDPNERTHPQFPLTWGNKHTLTREDQVKGGKTVTQKQRTSQRIRAMRRFGVRNHDIPWLLQRVEDPESNIIHVTAMLDQLVKEAYRFGYDPSFKSKLVELHLKAHKLMHGEKLKVTGSIGVFSADKIADTIINKIFETEESEEEVVEAEIIEEEQE